MIAVEKTSLWSKFKMFCHGFNKMQYRFIPPVVLLAMVWIIVRWSSSPSHGIVFHGTDKDDFHFGELDDENIKIYLNSMLDARTTECKSAVYENLPGKDSISIIMDFRETEFYDLKMTLESIKKFTPEHLISEIILLDDGTASEQVSKHVLKYVGSLNMGAKVKAYRSESQDGHGLSKFKASKVAKGSILVFLSSNVAVNQGWLEPLLDAINSDRHLVAVPHTDNLLSGYRFFQTPENLINVFNWNMDTLFMESSETGRFLTTPVMTGAAFAIDKEFLDSIGNFDESMGNGVGESIELSFRTWMCGGHIKIVTCSRVAVKNALQPLKIEHPANFQRIAELWLPQPFKDFAYKATGFSYEPSEDVETHIKIRKMQLKKLATCTDFRRYLTDVASMIAVPPQNHRYFGKIKSSTGYCIHPTVSAEGNIKMTHCLPHMYNVEMILTFDLQGKIKSQSGKCLDMTDTYEVQFKECEPVKQRKEQSWTLSPDTKLFQNVVHKSSCLVHDVQEDNHFLAVKPCANERTMKWEVIKS